MADETDSPSSPLNFWWWAAAAFLLLVAVLAVAALVVGGRDSAPEASPSSASTTSASTRTATPSVSPTAGACGVPVEDQSIPVDGPEATWEAQGYILVPSSDTYGPVAGEDPLWPCFAHSPTGALFAAAHFIPGMTGLPDYEQFARAAAVEDTALEAWLAQQDPAQHEQTAGNVGQYVGFRFQKVEPGAVVVDLAIQQDDLTGYFRASLVWDATADNWKGDVATTQFQLAAADPATFTTWQASNG